MPERYDIDTTSWRGVAQITKGADGELSLACLVDVDDGKPPLLHNTLTVPAAERGDLELLAKAWESGKVVFEAFALTPEAAAVAERPYFANPTYEWHLPHPRYGFATSVFAYAIHAGVVPEADVATAREAVVSVSKVERARGRDGLMWSCTLLVSGKAAADISDDGGGGEIRIYPRNAALLTIAERYAAATARDRAVTSGGMTIFDASVGTLAAELCDNVELTKELQKKVMFVDPKTGVTLTIRGKFTTIVRKQILSDYPDAKILNETIGKQTALDLLPEEADPGYYKRRCKTMTIFRPESGSELRSVNAPYSANVRQQLLAKFPNAVFLNETVAGQRIQPNEPPLGSKVTMKPPAGKTEKAATDSGKYPATAVLTFKNEGEDAQGPFGPVHILKDGSPEMLMARRRYGTPDPNVLEDLGYLPAKVARKLAKTHKLKFVEL
jgi:hypothetical protein